MTRFKDKPKKPMDPNTVAYCIDVPDRWTLTKRTNDWMDVQTTTDMRRGYRVGSFIDRAEFLFMRTCSMKKVSTNEKNNNTYFLFKRSCYNDCKLEELRGLARKAFQTTCKSSPEL